jgi:flagellar basal body-associated protein FliL
MDSGQGAALPSVGASFWILVVVMVVVLLLVVVVLLLLMMMLLLLLCTYAPTAKRNPIQRPAMCSVEVTPCQLIPP